MPTAATPKTGARVSFAVGTKADSRSAPAPESDEYSYYTDEEEAESAAGFSAGSGLKRGGASDGATSAGGEYAAVGVGHSPSRSRAQPIAVDLTDAYDSENGAGPPTTTLQSGRAACSSQETSSSWNAASSLELSARAAAFDSILYGALPKAEGAGDDSPATPMSNARYTPSTPSRTSGKLTSQSSVDSLLSGAIAEEEKMRVMQEELQAKLHAAESAAKAETQRRKTLEAELQRGRSELNAIREEKQRAVEEARRELEAIREEQRREVEAARRLAAEARDEKHREVEYAREKADEAHRELAEITKRQDSLQEMLDKERELALVREREKAGQAREKAVEAREKAAEMQDGAEKLRNQLQTPDSEEGERKRRHRRRTSTLSTAPMPDALEETTSGSSRASEARTEREAERTERRRSTVRKVVLRPSSRHGSISVASGDGDEDSSKRVHRRRRRHSIPDEAFEPATDETWASVSVHSHRTRARVVHGAAWITPGSKKEISYDEEASVLLDVEQQKSEPNLADFLGDGPPIGLPMREGMSLHGSCSPSESSQSQSQQSSQRDSAKGSSTGVAKASRWKDLANAGAHAEYVTAEQKLILQTIDFEAMPLYTSRYATKNEDGTWRPIDKDHAGHSHTCCRVLKNLSGPRFEYIAASGLLHVRTKHDDAAGSLDHVDMAIGQAHSAITYDNAHVEAQAAIRLAGGSVAALDVNVGLGVSTGAGMKDDSLMVKALGTGFTVGRKVGLSFLDNEISVDLGKLWAGTSEEKPLEEDSDE